jgi:hypothetical protein
MGIISDCHVGSLNRRFPALSGHCVKTGRLEVIIFCWKAYQADTVLSLTQAKLGLLVAGTESVSAKPKPETE